MPDPNHATKGSGGAYCCRCTSALGESVKVQPTTCDGEAYCPRCFVWKRMNEPEEQGTDGQPRFNASQCAAAECTRCGWTIVTFGNRPGQRKARCNHCNSDRAILVAIPKGALTNTEIDAIRDAQREQEKAAAS